MWRRELLKNKIFGVLFVVLGVLSIPIEWDLTVFTVTLLMGTAMFFSKENWVM